MHWLLALCLQAATTDVRPSCSIAKSLLWCIHHTNPCAAGLASTGVAYELWYTCVCPSDVQAQRKCWTWHDVLLDMEFS